MKILVTGAKGFVGRNLCAQLNNIRTGKARWYGIGPASQTGATEQTDTPEQTLTIDEVFEYDLGSDPADLDRWCAEADFVFNLAGVNRPREQSEFMAGNFGFASTLLETLRRHGNTCPVMLSSSQQASLAGRFVNSEYGRSKKAGEDLFLQYSAQTGAKVLVYRFPNLFGKWCRPNYNSAVATFCHNIAHDLPIQVNDRSVEMELLYIDDLVDEMIAALRGQEHRCEFNGLEVVPTPATEQSAMQAATPATQQSAAEATKQPTTQTTTPATEQPVTQTATPATQQGRYCYCPVTHRTTLGQIVDTIRECARTAANEGGVNMTPLPAGSLKYKLMTTYLSYLPKEKAIYSHKMNVDARGSFTELLHTIDCGQVSINISKPGITKGQHWHHSKFEYFTVVSGHALIQMRNEGDPDAEVLSYEVSGEHIQSIIMLPGYTHNIINLSPTEDLVTVMYSNEAIDPTRPDTYSDPVK